MTTIEVVTVIAAVAAAIVTIVNAVAAGWGRSAASKERQEIGARTDHKLDEIHTLTNSNLTNVKEQLATALDRIEKLEQLLVKRSE
jgi:hypothetical protein